LQNDKSSDKSSSESVDNDEDDRDPPSRLSESSESDSDEDFDSEDDLNDKSIMDILDNLTGGKITYLPVLRKSSFLIKLVKIFNKYFRFL